MKMLVILTSGEWATMGKKEYHFFLYMLYQLIHLIIAIPLNWSPCFCSYPLEKMESCCWILSQIIAILCLTPPKAPQLTCKQSPCHLHRRLCTPPLSDRTPSLSACPLHSIQGASLNKPGMFQPQDLCTGLLPLPGKSFLQLSTKQTPCSSWPAPVLLCTIVTGSPLLCFSQSPHSLLPCYQLLSSRVRM